MTTEPQIKRKVAAKVKVGDEIKWDGRWWKLAEMDGMGKFILQRGSKKQEVMAPPTYLFLVIRRNA